MGKIKINEDWLAVILAFLLILLSAIGAVGNRDQAHGLVAGDCILDRDSLQHPVGVDCILSAFWVLVSCAVTW